MTTSASTPRASISLGRDALIGAGARVLPLVERYHGVLSRDDA